MAGILLWWVKRSSECEPSRLRLKTPPVWPGADEQARPLTPPPPPAPLPPPPPSSIARPTNCKCYHASDNRSSASLPLNLKTRAGRFSDGQILPPFYNFHTDNKHSLFRDINFFFFLNLVIDQVETRELIAILSAWILKAPRKSFFPHFTGAIFYSY